MTFNDLGLPAPLETVLEALGIRQPRPIQAEAIPPVLAGRDLFALAPTGSGKTLAFVLPLLQLLGAQEARGERRSAALVLTPTRELAAQVHGVIVDLLKAGAIPGGKALSARLVHGGVSINPQMLALRGGADLLVATPGRLLDLVRSNALILSSTSYLVLDEADRILDSGFREEVEEILALLPFARQTLLFSATSARPGIEALAAGLRDPVRVGEEAPPSLAPTRHEAYLVGAEAKGPLLRRLLEAEAWDRVLVFTASNRRADNVVRKLMNNGIGAAPLHGDLSQAARTQGLRDFKAGEIRVLVASDLAARGLDIVGLPCVINYELPRSPLDYVHRAGRTGRSECPGHVISLVAPEEEAMLRLVEKRAKVAIARREAP